MKGLKNAFFRHYLSSLFGKLRHLVMVLHASMPSPKWSKMVKKNFFAKIRFRPYTFIIRGLDFFKILLTVRGGAGVDKPARLIIRLSFGFVSDLILSLLGRQGYLICAKDI